MASALSGALKTSAATVVSLTVVLTLSGCFSNPIGDIVDKVKEGTAQQGAEDLIDKVTGGAVDVELGGELPKGFPKSIPIIDGKIVTALSMPATEDHGQGWSVIVEIADAIKNREKVRERLVSAGYEETLWNPTPGITTGGFTKGSYGVTVGVMTTDDETGAGRVMYTVIELSGTE